MKISKTFSLEEDVLEKIVAYQKAKNLSSASAALERIILIELTKRDDIEKITENIKNLFENIKTTTLVEEKVIDKIENNINPDMDCSAKESISNMPD